LSRGRRRLFDRARRAAHALFGPRPARPSQAVAIAGPGRLVQSAGRGLDRSVPLDAGTRIIQRFAGAGPTAGGGAGSGEALFGRATARSLAKLFMRSIASG